MFTPPKNRKKGLIDLGADLKTWMNPELIANHFGCPVELIQEKFDCSSGAQITDVPQWIENLCSLFPKE
jgi:hypothetical protein